LFEEIYVRTFGKPISSVWHGSAKSVSICHCFYAKLVDSSLRNACDKKAIVNYAASKFYSVVNIPI